MPGTTRLPREAAHRQEDRFAMRLRGMVSIYVWHYLNLGYELSVEWMGRSSFMRRAACGVLRIRVR
jgi:hypothetical protein